MAWLALRWTEGEKMQDIRKMPSRDAEKVRKKDTPRVAEWKNLSARGDRTASAMKAAAPFRTHTHTLNTSALASRRPKPSSDASDVDGGLATGRKRRKRRRFTRKTTAARRRAGEDLGVQGDTLEATDTQSLSSTIDY